MASEKKLKGILKTSSSFDKGESSEPKKREMKWDEMNILATFHPADKDYGHTKIDEPPTPYNKLNEEAVSEGEDESLDPENLADRLSKGSSPRNRTTSFSSEEEEETEEEKACRKIFEQKRKLHYNEFHAAKLARQLMADEDDDEVEEKNENKDQNQAQGTSETSQ